MADTLPVVTAATIERVTLASLAVMAKFATQATPYSNFEAADIVAAVVADPTGDTARFLAGLIAKSAAAVATLDYVDGVVA